MNRDYQNQKQTEEQKEYFRNVMRASYGLPTSKPLKVGRKVVKKVGL